MVSTTGSGGGSSGGGISLGSFFGFGKKYGTAPWDVPGFLKTKEDTVIAPSPNPSPSPWPDIDVTIPIGGGGGGNTQPATNPNGGVDWQRLIQMLGPAALTFFGGLLDRNAQNAQAEATRERTAMLDRLAQDEMKRRDFYAGSVLPNLLRGTGYNPAQIDQKMRNNPLVR